MRYKRNGLFSLVMAFGFLSHNEAFPKGGRSRSASRGSRASRLGQPSILVIVPHPVAVKFEGQKGLDFNLTSEELTIKTNNNMEDQVSVSQVPSTRKFNLLSIICFAGAAVGVVLVIRVCTGRFNKKQTRNCRKSCHDLPKFHENLHQEATAGYKKIAQMH